MATARVPPRAGEPVTVAWTPETALAIARSLGLATLEEHHWLVIGLCREETARTGRSPDIHRLVELTGLAAAEMERLFPAPTETTLARIAGLAGHRPGPTGAGGCHTRRHAP